ERGIHDTTAVVHGHVAQQPHAPRLHVDVDHGEVRAVGEGPRLRIGVVDGGVHARLEAAELVGSEVHGAGEIAETEAVVGAPHHGAAVLPLAVVDVIVKQSGAYVQ